MTKIVGRRFRENGKIYFFKINDFKVSMGDLVIVETKMGQELGKVRTSVREIDESKLKDPLKDILKVANTEDVKHQKQNEVEEKKAFDICKKKIKEHKLEMNLVEVKYLFDNSKLIFYFTADNRIDFRDLVKDLASIFKTRIELRQISTRDQVKRLGGCGICGRELCCCSFLRNNDGATIKMAKEQNLSLNASKITGACGRLMCCLKYEENVYSDKMKHLPHPGAIVKTAEGEGTVDSVETLKEIVRVKFKDDDGENYYRKFPASELKVIKDTKRNNKSEFQDEEDIQELKKIEELDKRDKKNASVDDE